jgi:hypothetical protein
MDFFLVFFVDICIVAKKRTQGAGWRYLDGELQSSKKSE